MNISFEFKFRITFTFDAIGTLSLNTMTDCESASTGERQTILLFLIGDECFDILRHENIGMSECPIVKVIDWH
jgi:hypothetical protein